MKYRGLFYIIIFLQYSLLAQVILQTEEFQNNILVHGTSAPTNVWFAPSYNTPISWNASNGCPAPGIGFSGAWNNYWSNFVRLPELNCTGLDTIVLYMNVSHSYFSTHPNDWCRFYMWADGGYKHNVIKVMIDSVDVTYDSGVNGKGFKFSAARTCSFVEAFFDISAIANKSNILLYIEPKCGYNNSNVFFVWFDNIGVRGTSISVDVSTSNNKQRCLLLSSIVHESLEIVMHPKQSHVTYQVFGLDGKCYLKGLFNTDGFYYKIHTGNLKPGLYLLVLESVSTKQVLKFIKV